MEFKYFTNRELKELENLAALENKEIIVGGMVTNVRKGYTKTQKPYAILTLEDYSGSYEFPFFGRDYENFLAWLDKGLCLQIKGKVEKKTWGDQALMISINKIINLADVKDQGIQEINLKVPLDVIDENFIRKLERLPKPENSSAMLKFMIYDRELNSQVQLMSRLLKVDLTNELETFVEEYPGVSLKVK
jgi:DNA polymerase-3 subunit alpha